ncbi:MAG: hypothetical protein IPK33_00320 [Gemmatimonadetes bacterium]|nr:hypothetical protein [Gemmatimonadota bacterium]
MRPRSPRSINVLRDRGTVFDGTFHIWRDRQRLLPDGADPSSAPPSTGSRRSCSATCGPARADRRGDRPRTVGLDRLPAHAPKRLFDARVTLVAGTDNVAGLSFHGELEIYERAGIPAP